MIYLSEMKDGRALQEAIPIGFKQGKTLQLPFRFIV
jgi:hypothetical protein